MGVRAAVPSEDSPAERRMSRSDDTPVASGSLAARVHHYMKYAQYVDNVSAVTADWADRIDAQTPAPLATTARRCSEAPISR
jgi:hypothetical protein